MCKVMDFSARLSEQVNFEIVNIMEEEDHAWSNIKKFNSKRLKGLAYNKKKNIMNVKVYRSYFKPPKC